MTGADGFWLHTLFLIPFVQVYLREGAMCLQRGVVGGRVHLSAPSQFISIVSLQDLMNDVSQMCFTLLDLQICSVEHH